jgi:hypothetical protein
MERLVRWCVCVVTSPVPSHARAPLGQEGEHRRHGLVKLRVLESRTRWVGMFDVIQHQVDSRSEDTSSSPVPP